MPSAVAAKTFEFIAGNAALDFSNTMGGLRGVVENEFLEDFQDIVAWSLQARIIDKASASRLLALASAHPGQAERSFQATRRLREAIYAVFSAIASSKRPPAEALESLNDEIRAAVTQMEIGPDGERFAWRLRTSDLGLDLPRLMVANAARELLTSDRLRLVRECSGETCGWLFVDGSRNHSRHWCDMADCGNRAKVRRHRGKST
jgi:predicted RNA-binding Zn ribbon-like protein